MLPQKVKDIRLYNESNSYLGVIAAKQSWNTT